MTKHIVVRYDLLRVHSALNQAVVGDDGLLGRVVVSEVPHEADTVTNSVEASCVSSLNVPASTLVNITISSDQKTVKIFLISKLFA